jgi:hypothetical protein
MGAEEHSLFWASIGSKESVRLLKHEGLWKKVMLQKYIDPLSLEEWIRHPVKSIKGASIIRKI